MKSFPIVGHTAHFSLKSNLQVAGSRLSGKGVSCSVEGLNGSVPGYLVGDVVLTF